MGQALKQLALNKPLREDSSNLISTLDYKMLWALLRGL